MSIILETNTKCITSNKYIYLFVDPEYPQKFLWKIRKLFLKYLMFCGC